MARKYGGGKEGWPVRVNVRLRRQRPAKRPSDQDAWATLEEVARTGVVPAGWELAAVDWQGFHRRGRGAFVPTGWRHGNVDDLGPLLGPMLAGDVQIGWEKRTRRVKHEVVEWVRWRSVGTKAYPRGQWVSETYARRYPHLVYVGKQEVRAEWVTVTDYEAEVRVDY